MWLCTQEGFFSITRRRGPGPKRFFLRARKREDLVNAQRLCRAIAKLPIQEWPKADYRWRLIVKERQMLALMLQLGRGIDYPNFKNRIHERPDQAEKYAAYSSLWGSMLSIQERFRFAPPSAPRSRAELEHEADLSHISAAFQRDLPWAEKAPEPLEHRCLHCDHEWAAPQLASSCPRCGCHDLSLPSIR